MSTIVSQLQAQAFELKIRLRTPSATGKDRMNTDQINASLKAAGEYRCPKLPSWVIDDVQKWATKVRGIPKTHGLYIGDRWTVPLDRIDDVRADVDAAKQDLEDLINRVGDNWDVVQQELTTSLANVDPGLSTYLGPNGFDKWRRQLVLNVNYQPLPAGMEAVPASLAEKAMEEVRGYYDMLGDDIARGVSQVVVGHMEDFVVRVTEHLELVDEEDAVRTHPTMNMRFLKMATAEINTAAGLACGMLPGLPEAVRAWNAVASKIEGNLSGFLATAPAMAKVIAKFDECLDALKSD